MTKEQVKQNVKCTPGQILVRLILESNELIKGTGIVKTDSQMRIEPFVEVIAVGELQSRVDGLSTGNTPVMSPGDLVMLKNRQPSNPFSAGGEEYGFFSQYDFDAVISKELADAISGVNHKNLISLAQPGMNIVN